MEQATRRGVLAGLAAAGAWPRGALAAAEPVEVPVTLTPERVTVQASFGPKGPYGLVLDTGGAASLIEPALVREAGLQRVGHTRLGLHNTVADYDVVEYSAMTVGGAFRTGAVRFAVTDSVRFGEGLRGSLDAGFLTTYPSELLLDQGLWRLFDSALPAPPAGAGRLARALQASPGGFSPHLFADVQLGSGTLRLLLDTGAPRAIRLTPAAARKVGLSAAGRPSFEDRRGGKLVATVIRADRAAIGGVVLDRPVVSLDTTADTTGSPDGWMGLRLLRLLNMAFDPASRDLWVWRNRNAPLPETGRYGTL